MPAMPMDDDTQKAITLRLQTAIRETRESYARRPAGIEILPDVAVAQEWLNIEAAYSGIEQSLKFLIALEKNLTIGELLGKNDIVDHPGEQPKRRNRYRTHELGTLFSRLTPPTRESVEHDYAVWQSLYHYIPVATCTEFLHHIQGDDNEGHLAWRYCLIEGRIPPRNSTDAMLAIWASLIRRCEERTGIRHRAGTHTADEEVKRGLAQCLEQACSDREQDLVERGEPIPPPLRDELLRWAPSGTRMMNGIADLLGHRERYLEVPEREGSEPLREVLANSLRQLKQDLRRGARGALPTFVGRALGDYPAGESVRWNAKSQRFENVPWPLQGESRECPPQGATTVAPEDNAEGRLRQVWHHARVAGYEVKETRAFAADHNRVDPWHLRMRVYEANEGAERAVISVWQHQHLEGAISVEVHAPDALLRPTMDLWLLRCKRAVRAKWLAEDETF